MSKKRMGTGKIIAIIVGCLIVLLLFAGGCFSLGLLSSFFSRETDYQQGNIYEIRIEGIISASQQSGILMGGTTTPEEVMRQLDAAS